MKIGFIGTGNMGNPMAANLIKAGHQLTVHDLRREAAQFAPISRRLVATSQLLIDSSQPSRPSAPTWSIVETLVMDPFVRFVIT